MTQKTKSTAFKAIAIFAAGGIVIATAIFGGFPSYVGKVVTPEVSLAGKEMIYASNPLGNWEIYSLNFDTQVTTNLTKNSGNDMNPEVSPDGFTIVFYSNRTGNNEIYTLDRRHPEAPAIRLTTSKGENYDPVFSPDGKKIAFQSNRDDGHGDLFIMNPDGSDVVNLSPTMTTSEEWKPAFTNDGKRIIFTSRGDMIANDTNSDELYSLVLDTGVITQITKNDVPDWFPSVNPLTGKIVFISMPKPGSDDDIFTMNEDGSNPAMIQNMPGDNDDPVWGPENSVVFINNESGNYVVYMMRADGSDIRPLLKTDVDILSPLIVPLLSSPSINQATK